MPMKLALGAILGYCISVAKKHLSKMWSKFIRFSYVRFRENAFLKNTYHEGMMSPSRSYFSISMGPARRWECPIRAHRPLSWARRALVLPSQLLCSVCPLRGQPGAALRGEPGAGPPCAGADRWWGRNLVERPEPDRAAGTWLRGRNPVARSRGRGSASGEAPDVAAVAAGR